MSALDGAEANGEWLLYVIDEAAGDSGVIADGWSLVITTPGDHDPPETTITAGPANKTKKKSASFTFASSKPGSSFECNLDGIFGFSPCTSPQTIPVARGSHSFQVRAVDGAGNVDTTPAVHIWRVKKRR